MDTSQHEIFEPAAVVAPASAPAVAPAAAPTAAPTAAPAVALAAAPAVPLVAPAVAAVPVVAHVAAPVASFGSRALKALCVPVTRSRARSLKAPVAQPDQEMQIADAAAKGTVVPSPTDEGMYTQRASGRAANREWMNCYESVDNETMDDETMDLTGWDMCDLPPAVCPAQASYAHRLTRTPSPLE